MQFDRLKLRLVQPNPWKVLCVVAFVLSSCAETQTGVSTGDRSKYAKVAVVPQVNDQLLSVYWPNALSSPTVTEARMGWNASSGAGKISQEILSRVGTSVSVTSNASNATAQAADVVVILKQTPLNAFAENYDPGRDFLLSAITIAGAASAGGMAFIRISNEEAYQPRSVLRIDASNDSNICAVGLSPSLVDAKTGATLKTGRALMGVEKLPAALSGKGWSTLSSSERSTVLAYCQSALRRVVSQSFVELGIVG